MDNITFGQYVPGDSWLHKLDPRVKIILTIAMIVLIFLIPDLYGMCLAVLIFLTVFLTTGISLIKVIRGIKPMLFLLLFTVILQLIYTTSGNLLYTFELSFGLFQLLITAGLLALYFFTKRYIPVKMLYLFVVLAGIFVSFWLLKAPLTWVHFQFKIYDSGVNQAAFVFLRIVLMVGITSLLTLSTMTTDINNGLEAVLSPLKLIHVPVGVFSMLIALTLRFIPTLIEETKKIMNAQASRGVSFDEGSLKQKVSQIISLLIPMFVISFKRAEDLSNAMEARGYVIGEKRTKLDRLHLEFFDYVSLLITAFFFAFVILARIYM